MEDQLASQVPGGLVHGHHDSWPGLRVYEHGNFILLLFQRQLSFSGQITVSKLERERDLALEYQ